MSLANDCRRSLAVTATTSTPRWMKQFRLPAGNPSEVSTRSKEGRRRKLKKYAEDAELCEQKGIDQNKVKEARRAFAEGQMTGAAAMRFCGLEAPSDSSTNRVFLVRDSTEVARRMIVAAGKERAIEIANSILRQANA